MFGKQSIYLIHFTKHPGRAKIYTPSPALQPLTEEYIAKELVHGAAILYSLPALLPG
jgi:hypothetical protein